MLFSALLLLEFAVFGYIKSNNPWYIFSAGVSTAALCSVGYLLYEVAAGKASGNKLDYYLYFTDNRRFREEPFGFLPAAKRK